MDLLEPAHNPPREVRIAQVVARLNIGGPAIYTTMLAGHFKKGNWRSILITGRPLKKEGEMSKLIADAPFDIVEIPTLSREISPVKDFLSLLHIMKALGRFRPHIVHTHTAKAGFIGRVAAKKLGIENTVHTFHGHVFSHYFNPVITKIFINIDSERILMSIIR